ncbi:MAG: hypothetical protein ACOZB0_02525 [Pseudomonadota bacterium]
MSDKPEDLSWEVDLPLFSRMMMMQWALAMGLTATIMLLILGTIFAAQGEWDTLPALALLTGACTFGLWLLGLLIMAVLFRGKFRVRYTLTDTLLRYETIEPLAKGANTAAIIAGTLGRSPQTLGAGLIAKSQETITVRWSGAFEAKYDPARHFITLRNAWRPLFWIQCTPENYAQVAATVAAHMERRGTARRVSGKSPLPAYLGRTLLVILGCLPLFTLADEYDTGLFLPILILCFGLATVWLINLFGWVVLGGLLLQAGLVVADLFRLRESTLFRGETYYGYEVLGSEDFQIMAVAGLGAAALVWLALAALRGRWLAALLAGYEDMD